MVRALGIDLGSRRIGVALTDASGTVATPLAVLERSGERARDHERIIEMAEEHAASVIVVGLPLTLQGETGTAARRALAEVEALRRLAGGDVRIETHDERLTTVTADAALLEAGMRRKRRRETVDKIAASVMLQSWADARKAAS